MNDEDHDDGDNYYFDMDRLLPRAISDEAATLLCDFLTELSVIAEVRYSPHCRRHRDVYPSPVNPLHPWSNPDID
jgi:hypothetical protein